MTKLVKLLAIAMIMFVPEMYGSNNLNPESEGESIFPDGKNVEVYYFHYSRRCATCNAVENETQKALDEYFKEELDNGSLVFLSVNVEEESNITLVELYQISGQALILVSGDEKIDLTDKAFLNALTKPEKLRKAVKESIDKLTKP
jgi:hypothetical protein